MGMLNDVTGKTLEIALKGLAMRQQVIADNVANVDTPGFQASEVSFEAELQQALKGGGKGRFTELAEPGQAAPSMENLDGVEPQVKPAAYASLRNDGNNVDIDREMVDLSVTTLRYNTLARAISGRLAILRSAVTEGRK